MNIVRVWEGTEVVFSIRFNKRQKRIIIRPSDTRRFLVTAPRSASRAMIGTVIDEHAHDLMKMEPPIDVLEEMIRTGNALVFGETRRLVFSESVREPANTTSCLHVREGAQGQRKTALKKQFNTMLDATLSPVKHTLLRRLRLHDDDVEIGYRLMKSRFGSCNAVRKRITLNTELVHYPRRCSIYVLAHELAHLIHPDHSSRFKATLAGLVEDSEQTDRMMKTLRAHLLAGRFECFSETAASWRDQTRRTT